MEAPVSDYTAYHRLRAEIEKESLLSSGIWDDLNGGALFTRLDRTSSVIGRQYLYHLLHYDRLSDVRRCENVLAEFSGDKALRGCLQATLHKLDTPDAGSLAALILDEQPAPIHCPLPMLYALQLLPFLWAGLLYLTTSTVFVWLLVASVLFNLWIHYRNKARIQSYFFSIPCLWRLLKLSETLAQYSFAGMVDAGIDVTMKRLQPLRKRLVAFRFSAKLESDMAVLAWFVVEVLNILFLREVLAVAKAFRLLKDKHEDLHAIFRFWGMLDVLCSVSTLREELPVFALPEACRQGETFHAERLYHPLVEGCIPNSLTLHGQSVLITGSNMSGKTTFIRAVGVSVLCAKVLNTCFAASFRVRPDASICSAIHVEDDLLEGRSLFLQEVQTVRHILERSRNGQWIILLDELFKGTNTVERIAIAKAVLSALASQGNVVFASTHDLELATLLSEQYSLYHFCEQITDGTLSFDYLLKPGSVTERNAIRIIELYGYPAEVVDEARRCAGVDN